MMEIRKRLIGQTGKGKCIAKAKDKRGLEAMARWLIENMGEDFYDALSGAGYYEVDPTVPGYDFTKAFCFAKLYSRCEPKGFSAIEALKLISGHKNFHYIIKEKTR